MTAAQSPDAGFDLFLSHASADKPWVRTLAAHLQQAGFRIFFDEQDLHTGANWVLDLNAALQSRCMAVMLTRHSVNNAWVEREWSAHLATHHRVGALVPVFLEDVNVPPLLHSLQGIRAKHRDAQRVADELTLLLGRLGVATAADERGRFLGASFAFVLEEAGDKLKITDSFGRNREVTPPWRVDNAFYVASHGFRQLSGTSIGNDKDRAELHGYAVTLGKLLFGLLFEEAGVAELQAAAVPGQPLPLVTITSKDDELLALPWELLYHDGHFLLREQKLDLVRCTLGEVGVGALLRPPTEPFKLVVNVSAPEHSGLNYEAESYRITKALTEHCRFVPTELGTLDDLVETVKREQPTGIHYSGHGSPGGLVFEDDEGRADHVSIGEVVERLRKRLPGDLPPFFYLASCHGNDPGALADGKGGAESSAAALHRHGVAQVIGYFNPIVDELSTLAEEVLYSEIAQGQTTRYAVRQAREALATASVTPDAKHRPEQGGKLRKEGAGDSGAPSSHPFAWAQLVVYHRGPEYPLSSKVENHRKSLDMELRRTFEGIAGRKVLATGFIGRRTEVHRVRRRIRSGARIFVFQGLGGLGKSTLAAHVLPMLGGKEDICALWCQETEKQPDRAVAIVNQLLDYCRKRFGAAWEHVVQQVDRTAGDDPAQRFLHYLHSLLGSVPRLVLYLDNLESLLVGPDDLGTQVESTAPSAQAFGQWHGPELAGIWQVLCEQARDGDKLYVVASCRYCHDDFGEALLPVGPLSPDALYRLMGWFPGLRRLAAGSRAQLVQRLDGHPRAVEYANTLIEDALWRWNQKTGRDYPAAGTEPADLEREWDDLLEPALPQVQEQLWDNLLLKAIWDRVLNDRARRMLYRMTLLRRPWERALHAELGDSGEDDAVAFATAERLRQTSLLEQVELLLLLAADKVGPVMHLNLHPATALFVETHIVDAESLRVPTHRRLGDYLEIETRKSLYLETALEAGHHLFQAGEYDRAYELLGSASRWLQNRGRVREGLDILKPFLTEQIRKTMPQLLAGQLLGIVGMAHHRLGRVDYAICCYEQSLAIRRELGDRRAEGTVLGNLGLAYADLGQVEKAIGIYKQRLQIARAIGDRPGEGNALGSLGSAYHRLGHLDKAIDYYKKGLAIARETSNRRDEGGTLGNLGLAYADLGQMDNAIDIYERCLVITRDIGDRHGEGNTLGNLGSAYWVLGQMDKAITILEQALVIHREIGDRHGEGNDLGNLGSVYADLGQMDKAVRFYEQRIKIAREIGDRRGEGSAVGKLGTVHANLGQVDKAIGSYEQQLVITRAIGDREGEGVALRNLALAYADLGQLDKAIGLCEHALRIGHETKNSQSIQKTSAKLEQLRNQQNLSP